MPRRLGFFTDILNVYEHFIPRINAKTSHFELKRHSEHEDHIFFIANLTQKYVKKRNTLVYAIQCLKCVTSVVIQDIVDRLLLFVKIGKLTIKKATKNKKDSFESPPSILQRKNLNLIKEMQ